MKSFKLLISLLVVIFLTSCNINTTSSSTPVNSTSLSSNITTSPTENLVINSITLTSNSLITQFLGLTQRVRITAEVNSNIPVSNLDWYVDNVKSDTQNGLFFEFLPNEVKNYEINARANGKISNNIIVSVSFPSFNIANLNTVDNTTIEVTAERGLTFTIPGLVLAASSSYNLLNQKYTLKLVTPMVNGTTYNLRVSKTGFTDLTRSFVFESRRLEVGFIQFDSVRILSNSDGIYNIEKPFDDDDDSEPMDNPPQLIISMAHTNLEAIAVPVSFNVINPNNLTDNSKSIQQARTVLKATNITHTIAVSEEELVGLYTIEVKVGDLTRLVRVNVSAPVATVKIKSAMIYDLAFLDNSDNKYKPLTDAFDKVSGDYKYDVVTANAANEHIVFKPYNGGAYELTFEIEAKNFSIPSIYSGLNIPAHILSFGIADGKVIRYGELTEFNVPQGQQTFSQSLSSYRISQFIDSSTVAGSYVFVFTARSNLAATGSVTVNYSITVIVKEYSPELSFNVSYNDEEVKPINESIFVLYKPVAGNGLPSGALTTSISATISNFESPVLSSNRPGVSTLNIQDSEVSSKRRYLLDFSITYVGSVTSVQNTTSRTVIELGQTIPEDFEGEDYDFSDEFSIQEIVNNQNVTKTYKRYISANNNVEISLDSFIPYFTNISNVTISGNHVFTLRIGSTSRQFTLRILEPIPLIITDENSVKYGANNSENTDKVEYDEELDTYFVRMDSLSQTQKFLLINVYPFGMTSSPPNYNYTFRRITPSGSFESITSTVNLTLKAGPKPGTEENNFEFYDGRLKFPITGNGSEMRNVKVLADAPGEYLFEYTINTARKVIRVVLLPAPSLQVETVKFNDTELVSFNQAFLILGSESIRSIVINLKPNNIVEGYTYTINQDEVDASTRVLIDDIESNIEVTLELPAIEETESGIFELQKYFIRVYDKSEVLISITELNIFALKE